MIKICKVCGTESKALHMHMKKHVKELADKENILENENPLPEHAKTVEDIELTKEAVETAPEPEVVTNTQNCEYHLIMQFNNAKSECFTNNLKISILSYKPTQVLTEGFITIKKGSAEYIKKLTLIQARQLFQDNQQLEIFLSTFYSLYGQPQNLVNG